MSLFAGLSNEGLEQTEDRVGGGFKHWKPTFTLAS